MPGWTTAYGVTETTTSNLVSENSDRALMELAAQHRDAELTGQSNPTRGKSETQAQYQRSAPETQFDHGRVLDRGILASARDEGNGFIHGRPLRETDQVALPGGGSTSIAVAISMGFLQRNGDGTFTETAKAAAGGGNGGADDPRHFSIGEEGEAAMADIVQSTDPGTAIRAMDEILMRGEVGENTLAHLASQAGIEPDAMAAKIDKAHAGFFDAALSRLASRGVTNTDAFESFVMGNPQMAQKMMDSVRDLVMGRGAGNLDDLADAFNEKADRYMYDDIVTSLNEAGWHHMPDGRGGILVITEDGAQIPFQVAVREKIIRFVS